MSAQCANYFKSLGIKRGDRVMLVLKRHYQFWGAMLGLNKLGAIGIPATNQLQAHDFEYRFQSAGISAIICTADDGVAEQVDVRCGSIEQVVAGEQFDFVLANINRNILISMMPSFAAALPSGGELLMSGFLREDVVYIEAAAAEQGFAVENILEREGWMVVVCKKL